MLRGCVQLHSVHHGVKVHYFRADKRIEWHPGRIFCGLASISAGSPMSLPQRQKVSVGVRTVFSSVGMTPSSCSNGVVTMDRRPLLQDQSPEELCVKRPNHHIQQFRCQPTKHAGIYVLSPPHCSVHCGSKISSVIPRARSKPDPVKPAGLRKHYACSENWTPLER